MKRPGRKSSSVKKNKNFNEMDFLSLVKDARKVRNKKISDLAFNEIERRMRVKIKQISYRFNINGLSHLDIYQEALYALRYKAIKDYDPSRGSGEGPYPFDKFAILCIRRHLSTKLKASYQNKSRALNSSVSLDQDRNESDDEQLFLVDIVPKTDSNILNDVEHREYFTTLVSGLMESLSKLEKEVFLLYIKRHSYEEISEILTKRRKGKSEVNVKSIDNALSRIKNKAKVVFKKYGN